jgi:hypothetical protein
LYILIIYRICGIKTGGKEEGEVSVSESFGDTQLIVLDEAVSNFINI